MGGCESDFSDFKVIAQPTISNSRPSKNKRHDSTLPALLFSLSHSVYSSDPVVMATVVSYLRSLPSPGLPPASAGLTALRLALTSCSHLFTDTSLALVNDLCLQFYQPLAGAIYFPMQNLRFGLGGLIREVLAGQHFLLVDFISHRI